MRYKKNLNTLRGLVLASIIEEVDKTELLEFIDETEGIIALAKYAERGDISE
ncbi:MAG: hypothetical protein Q8936_21270 [Bacillota bacterium]|nr:hypothetical protein [Bacillota bacterium]